MIENLETLPGQIKDAEKNLHETIKQIGELELSEKTIVAKTMIAIIGMKEADNKPTYSNESKRKAELKERLSKNDDYLKLEHEALALAETKFNQEIALGFFKRTFRALEAITRI